MDDRSKSDLESVRGITIIINTNLRSALGSSASRVQVHFLGGDIGKILSNLSLTFEEVDP
ncbi:hypothetical protein QUA13_06565 [Microcoleus sp. S28C3]|uniref:hypothetical protein n=1 Tax=Microcoleus sp. S28C3 TaxID=3055414 RepID=UPI002FD22B71